MKCSRSFIYAYLSSFYVLNESGYISSSWIYLNFFCRFLRLLLDILNSFGRVLVPRTKKKHPFTCFLPKNSQSEELYFMYTLSFEIIILLTTFLLNISYIVSYIFGWVWVLKTMNKNSLRICVYLVCVNLKMC